MGMVADEHRWPIGPLVWDVRDSKGFSGCPSLEWLSDSRAEQAPIQDKNDASQRGQDPSVP